MRFSRKSAHEELLPAARSIELARRMITYSEAARGCDGKGSLPSFANHRAAASAAAGRPARAALCRCSHARAVPPIRNRCAPSLVELRVISLLLINSQLARPTARLFLCRVFSWVRIRNRLSQQSLGEYMPRDLKEVNLLWICYVFLKATIPASGQ